MTLGYLSRVLGLPSSPRNPRNLRNTWRQSAPQTVAQTVPHKPLRLLRARKRLNPMSSAAIRIRVPGIGLGLRVAVRTNNVVWHHGVVDLSTQSIETIGGEMISRPQVLRVRYNGTGTWLPPEEARAVVLLLSMIAGAPPRRLHEMAQVGVDESPSESYVEAQPHNASRLMAHSVGD
jgi:hypothetical protein